MGEQSQGSDYQAKSSTEESPKENSVSKRTESNMVKSISHYEASAENFLSLIFQPPKIGPVILSPDDLVAAYDAATQSVVAIKRSQYESGTITAPKPFTVPTAAPAAQKTSELIFQVPKIGHVDLSPDDLIAVYDAASQGVILVTRSQYDQGEITQIASAPQKTSDLIFQPPKIGRIDLSPDDLLAVYDAASQGVILVTRQQYDKGEITQIASTPQKTIASTPQKTSDLIFQPPKIGCISLSPDDLLAVYDAPSQGVILVTRQQYDKGEI